jgi:hypothetical protein
MMRPANNVSEAVLTVCWRENALRRSTTHGNAVMNRAAPLVPSLDQDLHFVLCAFGRAGLAYVETDPAEADATTIVRALLRGLYDRPLRVVALNAEEGWSRDVSEVIAAKVRDVAEHEDIELTSGTLDFIEMHTERMLQPTLPLW